MQKNMLTHLWISPVISFYIFILSHTIAGNNGIKHYFCQKSSSGSILHSLIAQINWQAATLLSISIRDHNCLAHSWQVDHQEWSPKYRFIRSDNTWDTGAKG